MVLRSLLICGLVAALPSLAGANGHGPVFGAATPTLGKRGWQLDQAWMGRIGEGRRDDEQMLRTMIAFGITEDLQISGSLPITLDSAVYMPRGRLMASMSSSQDIEGILGWRFHRNTTGPGARFESTVSVGASLPLQDYRADAMRATTSVHVSGATGYVSRAHYVWVGGGYQRSMEREGDRPGDSVFYSLVYGYRPPALRLDYPKPDLRFFVEAIGEQTARGQHHGFELSSSGGRSLLVGPSVLLLYKAYALEGGLLFPVYQRTNSQPEEQFRFGLNFSYFFWRR
jgi:hypothetical protein